MESMIAYRFGTLPHQSIHMSSGYNAAITTKPCCFSRFSTKPQLSFSHNSSFSLPKGSGGRPLEHILGPITFTVGHPSTYLTDQKSRPPQAQAQDQPHFFTADHFEKVLAVAKELEKSKNSDIAEKLMKLHEPSTEDTKEQTAEDHREAKIKILKLLIAEEKFELAEKYCVDIGNKTSIYEPEYLKSQDFYNLKFVVMCGLHKHKEADDLRLGL